MNKKMYLVLTVALVGLAACGNRNRHKVAEVVEETVAVVQPVEEPDSLAARFQGSDGITRKIYWVDAMFYPKAMRARLTVEGKVYQLEQYPTGSGFGYRNAEVDLRGKGDDADLDFTDASIRDLKLVAVDE